MLNIIKKIEFFDLNLVHHLMSQIEMNLFMIILIAIFRLLILMIY
jgi:hypothetical protein